MRRFQQFQWFIFLEDKTSPTGGGIKKLKAPRTGRGANRAPGTGPRANQRCDRRDASVILAGLFGCFRGSCVLDAGC